MLMWFPRLGHSCSLEYRHLGRAQEALCNAENGDRWRWMHNVSGFHRAAVGGSVPAADRGG